MTTEVTNQDLPFIITETALKEISYTLKEKNIPTEYCLRIGIKGGGGCGGVNYILGFDKKAMNDVEYLHKNISVLIDKKHMMFVIGITLDFEDGAQARGFVFTPASTS